MNPLSITVPDSLFVPAESASFDGTFLPSPITQNGGEYRFDHPLNWHITISNTGGALYVGGVVEGDATTECARCLEDATYHLKGEVEGYFLLPGSERELTEEEEDEYEKLGEDHSIDLEPLLVAALVLDMPFIPLCRDDCKGICPTCGANLNTESCTCNTADAVDEMNPFAVLKNYHFDNE